ncbi:sarcosine oxidase subunit delta [Nonomuraea sp. NBC_01738]|uniref:sarcosine oxidase subunit delta n=1 Tax=Nonomuraea sp. NBC_01738 TaxID=2976003 RepID=UPI002E16438A|nr:sarcosine oxidase subunit delta [Nonomuraea sp. NBC_01738]
MMLIDCPHCGPRDENEFSYGGQAGISYPERPAEFTDEQWAGYVFWRDNPKGWFTERWFHAYGCRTWLTLQRHTVTHEIRKPG